MEIKKGIRVGLGAVTLLSTVVLAACGNSSSSSASSSDEINWFIPTEISTLDISKVTDTYSSIALVTQEVTFFVVMKMASYNLIWLKK